MTNIGRRTLLTCFLCLLVVALVAVAVVPCFAANKVVANADEGSYYSGLNTSLTGDAFRTELAKLLKDTHKKETTYDGLKSVYLSSDSAGSGKIVWFYTGTVVSFSGFGSSNGSTNREHVWPKDGGSAFPANTKCGSDAHHLRPTEAQLNSTRGSRSYGEVAQITSNIVKENGSTSYGNKENGIDALCYTNGNFFYPAKGYRGATARILMYVQTRWGNDYSLRFVDGAGKCKTIGDFDTLYKWHLEEPVTDEEIARNEAVYKIQGNRNPFIDHPEYAYKIYSEAGKYYEDSDATALANSVKTLTKEKGDPYHNLDGGVTPDPNPDKPVEKYVAYVSVDGTIVNKTYEVGNVFNPDGLSVKVTYSDGSVIEVAPSACEWLDANTGLKKLSAGTTAVVCRYMNCDSAKISGIVVNNIAVGNKQIEITRQGAFGNSTGGYQWYDWDVDGIKGKAFIYAVKKESMQFNYDKASHFLFNSTPLSGGIKSITIKGYVNGSGVGEWELLTSSNAYTEVEGIPTEGNNHGKKIVTAGGVSWELSGDDEYFSLNYVGNCACYITGIVVTYGSESQSSTDTISLDNLSTSLEVGKTTKIGVKASGSVSYATSDSNVCTVDGEGNVAAVGKGVATITVTCGNARAEMLIVVGESTTPDPDPTPNPNPNPDPFKDSDSSAGCNGVVSTVGTITALLIAVAGAAIVRKRHE